MLYESTPTRKLSYQSTTNDLFLGRRPKRKLPTKRHLHHQQAAREQADLALLSALRAQTVRLGGVGGEHASEGRWRDGRLGVHAGRHELERAAEEGGGD